MRVKVVTVKMSEEMVEKIDHIVKLYKKYSEKDYNRSELIRRAVEKYILILRIKLFFIEIYTRLKRLLIKIYRHNTV